jgi:hypothetical protein
MNARLNDCDGRRISAVRTYVSYDLMPKLREKGAKAKTTALTPAKIDEQGQPKRKIFWGMTKPPATPRDKLRPHPYAEKFGPPLSESEFEALKLNIEEHGLRIKIPIWKDKESPTGWSLLGGRHRLKALVELGKEVTTPKGPVPYRSQYFERVPDDTDPLAYVISENLIGRQLTPAQKKTMCDELIKLRPNENNLRLAKLLRMSPTFVGKRRGKLEEAGDVSTVETRTDSKGRKQPAKKPRAKADDSTASMLPDVEMEESAEPLQELTNASGPGVALASDHRAR